MDYENLLYKYMTLIMKCEGIDYLDQYMDSNLDPEELRELECISDEIRRRRDR